MFSAKQGQAVEGNSTAYQAGTSITVINNNGLSETAVLSLIKDQVRSHLNELRGEAIGIAQERGEAITEKYISRLSTEYPDGLAQARDPDFQYAIATVQKEYMRCGDDELGELLVDLLVDRSKQSKRDILQIVLNESIAIAPKLTTAQTAVLALMFILRYSKHIRINNKAQFVAFLEEHIKPFCEPDLLATQASTFQHLQYTGCGTIPGFSAGTELESLLRENYAGIFMHGFGLEVLDEMKLRVEVKSELICPSVHGDGKLQIAALNKVILEEKLISANATQAERAAITAKFEANWMDATQVKEVTLQLCPWMDVLFARWSSTPLTSFILSSVGIAIGHAKLKGIIKRNFGDLKIWIN